MSNENNTINNAPQPAATETTHKNENMNQPTKNDDEKMNYFIKTGDKKMNKQSNTVQKENPQSLFGNFQFQFFIDVLKPDCLFEKDEKQSYVFFNLEKFYNLLYKMYEGLLNKYPNTLEHIKESIIAYIKDKNKHDKEFIEDKSIVKAFFRRIKFIFLKEIYNKNAKNEIIKLAYCLAQLNDLREDDPEKFKKSIAFVDTQDYKITPYNYEILDNIKQQFSSLKITGENINEIDNNIELLKETFNEIRKQIENDFLEDDKPILMSFLIKNVDDKLSKFEDLNIPEDTETYKKMTDLLKN